MMKKILSLVSILLFSLILVACGNEATGIDKIKEELKLTLTDTDTAESVTKNFSLPSKIGEATIKWLTSDSGVIAISGSTATVVRAETDKTVTITAIITLDGEQAPKPFILTVKGTGTTDPGDGGDGGDGGNDGLFLWHHFEFPGTDLAHGYSDSSATGNLTDKVNTDKFVIGKRRANTLDGGNGLVLSGASTSALTAWVEFNFVGSIAKIEFKARMWSELDEEAITEAALQVKNGDNWVTVINLKETLAGQYSVIEQEALELNGQSYRLFVNAGAVGTQNTARILFEDMKVYGSVEKPGGTNPQPTDPGTTDPGTTDPGTTDPGTTDPGTTDPGTTDPGTTDPGTTVPSGNVATIKSIYTAEHAADISAGDITSHFNIANGGAGIFTIAYEKGAAKTHSIFKNASGQIRLYPGSGNGNSITITVSEGYVIDSIEITFGIQNGGLTVNGSAIDTTMSGSKLFTVGAAAAVLKNGANATSGSRIEIVSITVNYSQV